MDEDSEKLVIVIFFGRVALCCVLRGECVLCVAA